MTKTQPSYYPSAPGAARWPGFGYVQVPGLANRHISRYLRTQRKNMLRFFQERGLYKFAERMQNIRKSNQDMLTKNRRFQQVLNDYAQLTTPTTVTRDVPGAILQRPAQVIAGETEQAENP